MAAGTTIEKLFISLGLDMTALDSDLLTAGKTVNQGMANLKVKAQQSKLKMDIDMSAFAGAERSTEALAVKTKHLTDQFNIQKQAVNLMNAAYQESVAAKGADDAASQRILTRLLREQKAEADLARQLKETNAARAGGAAGPTVNTGATNAASAAMGLLAGSFGKARDAGASAGNAFSLINTKVIALTAIAASGAGLFNLVKGAVDAGDAAYKLATRLNLTAAEAGSLGRMLKISDVDSQSFISTMIRLDRSVTNVGKNGNELTEAMQLFNFSLVDSGNNLLPMNDQLAQLAKGYSNAAKAEEEQAFISDVLGVKGAALVPMLRDYAINAEAASRIKTIGIDPQEAHELAVQFQILNLESKQMSNALGMALMPIAKEVLPLVISGFDSMIGMVKNNKDSIIKTTTAMIDVATSVKDFGVVVGGVAIDWAKFLGHLVEIDSIKDVTKAFDDLSNHIRVITEHPFVSAVEAINPFSNEDMIKPYLEQYKAEKQASEMSEKLRNINLSNSKTRSAEERKDSEATAGAIISAEKKRMDAAKANKLALIEMDDEVYKSSHTALENELHDVDVKSAKLADANVSDETVAAIAAARKKIIIDKDNKEQQKILDDKNKEIKKSTEQMETELYKITHNGLEIRLRDIDIERKEWIKKTNDEVQATQLAEQQKTKAIKDAINAQFSAEEQAVKAAILEGKSQSEAYNEAHKKVMADKKAEAEAYDFVKKQNGIYEPGDTKKGITIDGNSAFNSSEIIKELTVLMSTFDPYKAGPKGGGNATNNITVNMPITATVNNDADISTLADKVADKIKGPLLNALGGDENGY